MKHEIAEMLFTFWDNWRKEKMSLKLSDFIKRKKAHEKKNAHP